MIQNIFLTFYKNVTKGKYIQYNKVCFDDFNSKGETNGLNK